MQFINLQNKMWEHVITTDLLLHPLSEGEGPLCVLLYLEEMVADQILVRTFSAEPKILVQLEL